jgi:hypothetical protein
VRGVVTFMSVDVRSVAGLGFPKWTVPSAADEFRLLLSSAIHLKLATRRRTKQMIRAHTSAVLLRNLGRQGELVTATTALKPHSQGAPKNVPLAIRTRSHCNSRKQRRRIPKLPCWKSKYWQLVAPLGYQHMFNSAR